MHCEWDIVININCLEQSVPFGSPKSTKKMDRFLDKNDMLHKTETLSWLCLWEEVLIAHWFMSVWTLLSQDLFSQNFLTARTSSVRPSFSKASYGRGWILAHKGSFPSGCGGGGRTDYKNFKVSIRPQIYMHSSLFGSHLPHPVPIRLWNTF